MLSVTARRPVCGGVGVVYVFAPALLTLGFDSVRAQVMLDVSKITCWQFVTYKVTNPKYLAVWLSGYDHGRRGDVVLDMQQVVANADKLEAYCTKNPDVPMMQAAETILKPQD